MYHQIVLGLSYQKKNKLSQSIECQDIDFLFL